MILSVSLSIVLTACARLPRNYISQRDSITPVRDAGTLRVNINTAGATELERLPGIGAVLAERIVKYRQDHGRFRRAEHLMMVRGISERKFQEIRKLVSVE